MLPATFVVNLPTLVLHLLERFLNEQTLCGIVQIHADTMLRVISDRLVILAEIIAKQAQLKIAAPLERAMAFTPAAT